MNSSLKNRLDFNIDSLCPGTAARACTFRTLHNEVRTPVFMPVATLAVLRSQNTGSVEALGFPVLLANTYHLLLRPGTGVFQSTGGIHNFMKWNRSVLTDSGGFQVFSLSKDVRITEEGARFRSYMDGSRFMLSPETSIATQKIIGSDIMMAMDQCVQSTLDWKVCSDAADITARWAERSLGARGDSAQSIFGIVQGACYEDLRRRSAEQITSLPFDGYAIGGLAVGETGEKRNEITGLTASLLPQGFPRYLMGVGTPMDLLESVHRGVDMFDCILPTALAQQGVAFTSHGRIEMRRGIHKYSDRPLDAECSCPACARYSRAYLHHLVKSGEYYGASLIGLHNLTFYKNLMDTMRNRILEGTFLSFYNEQRMVLDLDDVDNPVTPPKRKVKPSHLELGNYEIISQHGFNSIRQKSTGEVMHSVSGPVEESRLLYARQTMFAETACGSPDENFVIWDVGMGAASNVMAAISEYENLCGTGLQMKRLVIVSFENDLDPLRLSVRNPSLFPHMRHAAPGALLENGIWNSRRHPVEWRLLKGDFPDTMEPAELPDCIYYDPFSLNTGSSLWRYETFSMIHRYCQGKTARLFTYSSSTAVRAALLAAGFFVGRGPATGPKTETTTAVTSLNNGKFNIELLAEDWLSRYARSTSRFLPGLPDEEQKLIDDRVTAHPQFRREP